MIELTINGAQYKLDIDPDTPLLWAIRDAAGLTGTKYGCGRALCGACTVHIEGRPMRSCIVPVATVAGQSITTIEGLDSEAAWSQVRVQAAPAVANALYAATGRRFHALPLRVTA